jgi:hypothetical protein
MKSQADHDIAVWLAADPAEIEPDAYPKLMYNVNLPPMLVRDAAAAASIGSSWQPVDLTPPEEGPEPDVPPVEISPESAAPAAAGGPGSFSVTMTGSGTSGTWTVDKDAGATWLTVDSPTTPQSADGTVMYTVAANTGASRTGNIYVNGKTFTVTQAAPPAARR